MARAYSSTSTYTRVSSALVTAPPFTMACWFNVANTTANHELMSVSNSSVTDDYFRLVASGVTSGDPVFCSAAHTTQSGQAATSVGFSANTWTHACGVFTTSTSRTAYINGGNSGSNTDSRVPTGLDRTSVALISRPSPVGCTGSIAEAAIWNVALDAAEIAALAKGICPRLIRPSALVFYAPLVREVRDLKGNTITDTSSVSSLGHPRIYR